MGAEPRPRPARSRAVFLPNKLLAHNASMLANGFTAEEMVVRAGLGNATTQRIAWARAPAKQLILKRATGLRADAGRGGAAFKKSWRVVQRAVGGTGRAGRRGPPFYVTEYMQED